jgi:hypothetical protein
MRLVSTNFSIKRFALTFLICFVILICHIKLTGTGFERTGHWRYDPIPWSEVKPRILESLLLCLFLAFMFERMIAYASWSMRSKSDNGS